MAVIHEVTQPITQKVESSMPGMPGMDENGYPIPSPDIPTYSVTVGSLVIPVSETTFNGLQVGDNYKITVEEVTT